MNDMGVTQTAGSTAAQQKEHSLVAIDRSEITVKGVSEVISFNETLVHLVTVCGVLNLEGEGLRVHGLNLKEGIVAVTGKLNGVLYEDVKAPQNAQPSSRGKTRSRRLWG